MQSYKTIYSHVDEENGKKPTVVKPKLDPPTEDSSDVPAVPTCRPKKSVEKCGECKTTAECISGFCCPNMKRCVDSPMMRCSGRSWRFADCKPPCRAKDLEGMRKCNCRNSRFPDKWGLDVASKSIWEISEKVKPFIGLPTCEGN